MFIEAFSLRGAVNHVQCHAWLACPSSKVGFVYIDFRLYIDFKDQGWETRQSQVTVFINRDDII